VQSSLLESLVDDSEVSSIKSDDSTLDLINVENIKKHYTYSSNYNESKTIHLI